MDYRQLLKDYMASVLDMEGSTYVDGSSDPELQVIAAEVEAEAKRPYTPIQPMSAEQIEKLHYEARRMGITIPSGIFGAD